VGGKKIERKEAGAIGFHDGWGGGGGSGHVVPTTIWLGIGVRGTGRPKRVSFRAKLDAGLGRCQVHEEAARNYVTPGLKATAVESRGPSHGLL
jgi:hypothetical protein